MSRNQRNLIYISLAFAAGILLSAAFIKDPGLRNLTRDLLLVFWIVPFTYLTGKERSSCWWKRKKTI